MHLFEKTVSSELIFDGKIITVKKDRAELENGEVVTRELVVHPGGVCIVPVTEEGEILMVKQFRYPFQEALTELPAGKLEFGEYLATGLSYEKQSLDEDEFLDVIKVKLEDAVQMVMDGKLPDAKTQCAVLKAARLLGK